MGVDVMRITLKAAQAALVWVFLSATATTAQAQGDSAGGALRNAISLYQSLQSGTLSQLANRPRVNPYFARRDAPLTTSADQALERAGANFNLFQYGRFCGAGWPTGMTERVDGETGQERKARRLANLDMLHDRAGPVDHIDAICYAHDYCYDTIGRDTALCDYGMMATLFDSMARFEKRPGGDACANLLMDMAIAFVVKPPKATRTDLVLQGVRMYQAYNEITGGDFDAFLQQKLRAQGLHGYPGRSEVCRLPNETDRLATTRQVARVFANYVNGADYINGRVGGGAPTKGKVSFRVCVAGDAQRQNCDDVDQAMVSAKWKKLRNRIYRRTLARAAGLEGETVAEGAAKALLSRFRD